MIKQFDHVFVFPKLKMMYCFAPKVGTTSWKRLFLAIYGYPEFMHNRSVGTHYKADEVFLKLSTISRDKAKMALSAYKSFFFVRNPYTRLLSVFRDKLELPPDKDTYSFQSSVKKWIRKYEPDLAKMYPSNRISFEEFVTFYTGLKARKNEHWEDMYELCHPCTLSYDFIGTYETLETDKKILIDQMQSEIRLPDGDLMRRTTHSSNNTVLMNYYSRLSDHQLEELSHSPGLTRDCKLFGYEMPECIRRNFTKTTNI